LKAGVWILVVYARTHTYADTKGTEKIDEIPYTDFPTLQINKNESTEMPFRYVKDEQGDPVMPEGMLELIKEDANKSLDDLF